VHPFYTYIIWLIRRETALLFLGLIGAGIIVWRPRNPLAFFTALWAFGLIAAYSLIPYKTPWLLLNFVVPLAMIAGYAIQSIYQKGQAWTYGIVVLGAAVALSIYQTIDLNFFNYDNDDEKYVYVYAHTKRGMLDLVAEVDKLSKQYTGDLTGITIVSPDYWPLPWYFRNYSRVGYYGRMAQTTEPLIIANESQKEEIDANFGALYKQVPSLKTGGAFELRPGVKLLLYSRRDDFKP
jgi:predicted membrane-bound mannosyltransferase